MNKILLILPFLISVAYGQQKSIAIINTEDDGMPSIKQSELDHLTDRLRDIALKTLPGKKYAVLTQENIVDRFGSIESAAKKCREATCLADLGRKMSADYIAQGRINRLDGVLTIKVEIYDSKKSSLAGMLQDEANNVPGLLSVLDEKAQDMFREALGISAGKSKGNGYLIDLTTDPEGASPTFNEKSYPGCRKTPCKIELPEGKINISATLPEYTTADTIVSITHDKQEIAIKLEPASFFFGPMNRVKYGIGGGPGLYKYFEEDESFVKDGGGLKKINGFKIGLLTSFPVYVGNKTQLTFNPELYYTGPTQDTVQTSRKASMNIPLLITLDVFGWQLDDGNGYVGSAYLEAGPQYVSSSKYEIIGGIGFSSGGLLYFGLRFVFNSTDYSANALEVAIRILATPEVFKMLADL